MIYVLSEAKLSVPGSIDHHHLEKVLDFREVLHFSESIDPFLQNTVHLELKILFLL